MHSGVRRWASLRLLIVPALIAGCASAASPVAPAPAGGLQEPLTDLQPAPTEAGFEEPQPPGECENGARFLEDLTIPDGSLITPGDEFEKRWSMQNTGTCDWGPSYRLVRLDTSDLLAPEEAALYPARSGTNAIWQVTMTAPAEPGTYQSRWQARAPDGTLFGDIVFVIVEVSGE